MNYDLLIMILFFIMCLLTSILLIYVYKDDNEDDLEKQLIKYSIRFKEMKKELEFGNKEINRLEKEILKCKKKLGLKLFKR